MNAFWALIQVTRMAANWLLYLRQPMFWNRVSFFRMDEMPIERKPKKYWYSSLTNISNQNSRSKLCYLNLMFHSLCHSCRVIALGNGTACRDTEMWLSSLFQAGILDNRSIRYSIVNENGASIYSCSTVATKEFPNMDMNLISAGLALS